MLAQLGSPDMRIPIAYALSWPDRMATPCARLDLAQVARLDFEAPDPERFPALRLAREALVSGGSSPTVLNAANEVAVAAFLEGRIGFLDIAAIVEQTMEAVGGHAVESLDDVLACDSEARRVGETNIRGRAH
jgi:1-deoxy-D-xylulose-5-phosphate reductoisomerase